MSIKPGSLLSVLSFVTKGGIHQINVPPENLFTPKLGSLHKYQIDFKRVPLEPSFSAFHVLLLSIENDASGCGCSVALSINSITMKSNENTFCLIIVMDQDLYHRIKGLEYEISTNF